MSGVEAGGVVMYPISREMVKGIVQQYYKIENGYIKSMFLSPKFRVPVCLDLTSCQPFGTAVLSNKLIKININKKLVDIQNEFMDKYLIPELEKQGYIIDELLAKEIVIKNIQYQKDLLTKLDELRDGQKLGSA